MNSQNGTPPTRKFAAVLRSHLTEREEFLTHTGNINWRAVAARLEGVHYETLRKAVAGDRPPTPLLMERCAELLGLRPEIFTEYELWLAQRDFDVREVGWDAAMRNLSAWAERNRAR